MQLNEGAVGVVKMYNEYNDIPRNPIMICLIALFLGVAGLALLFLADMAIIAIGLGAIGMVAGGYSISKANRGEQSKRMQYMVLAGAGIMTSVMSFMFGLASL
jgi:hypothetical protein